nr:bacterial Ig-like domain-containing protein [Treponemataceae bacterium]
MKNYVKIVFALSCILMAFIVFGCNPEVTQRTLTSISVSGSPSKTVYLSGESFDPTGITVTATYSDGSTETVTTYTNDLGTDICYSGKALTLSY